MPYCSSFSLMSLRSIAIDEAERPLQHDDEHRLLRGTPVGITRIV